MSKAFGIAFAVTLAIIGFLVWQGFVATKGNHLEPTGKIGKVRTEKVDDNEFVMVLDFNLKNDSDQDMVVRSVEAILDGANGSPVNGSMLAATDLNNVFRNYPALGEQFNPTMRARDVVKAHESVDRMVGFRFDGPEDVMLKRKGVVLRIEDITGPMVELKAK